MCIRDRPLLLEWIQYQEPARLSQLRRAAKFRRLVNSIPIPTTLQDWLLEERRLFRAERATCALATLGPAAAPVIPNLTRMLNNTKDPLANRAAYALPHLGPKALPPLMTVLTNTTIPNRSLAAQWI